MSMPQKRATETSSSRLVQAGADERKVHDAAAAGAPRYFANFLLGCEGRASAIDSKGHKLDVDVQGHKLKDNTFVAMNGSRSEVQAYNAKTSHAPFKIRPVDFAALLEPSRRPNANTYLP